MAARFAAANPEVDGLVLWGSYPEDSVDLAGTDLEVVSIYGSNDRLSTPAEVLAAGARLPAGTTFVPIEGGNHAQFGDYGEQRGDGPAGIAADDQWAQVAGATVAALDRVAGG
jgi:pimeloyl-ACP methyl ester carboxylesterase